MIDSLIPEYRKMAATETGNFQGFSILSHTKSIGALIKATGSTTLLDFGCGRGEAYRSPRKIHQDWGIHRGDVTLYDPAFRPSSKLPRGTYDIVIASDVMEHIPPEEVDEFIERLFGYAKKAVWASVCCREAKKFFPGTETNLHVCVKPFEWWEAKFLEAASRRSEKVGMLSPWGAIQLGLVETP